MGGRLLLHTMLLLAVLTTLAACGGTAGSPTGGEAGAPTGEASLGATAATATEPATTDVPSPDAPEQTAAEVTTTTSVDYGRVLTIMTHDSFDASVDVIAEFERENKVNVRILKSGDAGALVNRAILAKSNPVADVLYGVDNTFFSRAVGADIFELYKPSTLEHIPRELQLDTEGRLTPVDYGVVNLNYDKAAFEEGKLPLPQTLRDLTRPEYKGKLVVPSPATSSPGLAFLMATVATFGEGGDYPWTKFWEELRNNDVQVVDGWQTAYYTNFSGSSGKGPQPIVLSYATSPAAEVYFSEGKLNEPSTGNIVPPQGAFRQIEFVGILRGTKNRELAERWVDFMTGQRFQADIPLKMFVYPANRTAALPEVFQKFAPAPPGLAVIPPEEIAAKREAWIGEWTRIVQR